jgi:acyl-coenzyme A synthetase/AMP-(fatty) acid ligase
VDDEGRETRWSFGLLDEQSSRLAHVLQASGFTRGAIVPVLVASLPRRIIAQLAVMKAGGVSLLVRPGSTTHEIRQHIVRVGSRLAIAGPEDAERFPPDHRVLVLASRELDDDLRSAPALFTSAHVRSDEPALLVLTGGTTGPPKMVVHTHGSKFFYYLRWTMSFDPDDLCWDFAGRWWIAAWRYAVPVFDRPIPGAAGPDRVLATLTRYPITRMMAPARLYGELVKQDLNPLSFSRLRACWSSGQPLDVAVFHAWKEKTGIPLYDRYNQSECGEAPVKPCDDTMWQPGCIGRPFPWIDMAVIDHEGHRLPPGQLGELAIRVKPRRPPSLFREYWGDPAATAARHRGDWYLTGDIGRSDSAGLLFIDGRADDIINCGGENIGPFELESVLLLHPAVREVAVVGKPDCELGEVPKAFVVAASEAEATGRLADELIRHVNEAIHPHKRLREVEFTRGLPRTAEGKIRRCELRARSWFVPE